MTAQTFHSMPSCFVAFLAILAAFSANPAAEGQDVPNPVDPEPAARAFDIEALNGEWRPQQGQLAGRELPREHLETIVLTIQDGRFQTRGKDFEEAGVLRIAHAAAAGESRPVDVVIEEGPNAGKTIPVILRLKGDRMTVCYGLVGERPTKFETSPENEHLLLEYTRAGAGN